MAKQKKTLLVQQPVIADYRMGLFNRLRKHYGKRFQVIAGVRDFGGNLTSTEDAWKHFGKVQNVFLLNGRFLWQKNLTSRLLSADVVILNANLRILSNMWILVLRRFLARRTILWGHAKGKNNIPGFLRGMFLDCCDGFIAYTQNDMQFLSRRYPKLQIWVASNACMSAYDCFPGKAELSEVNTILYVGRLIKEKKPDLLIEAFIYGYRKAIFPKTLKLVFVGDGRMRSKLENMARTSGLQDLIEFKGHVSDIQELRDLYRFAICSVSPGYVGLSAIQSFGFGVPMLVARNEPHSPEIEACKEVSNTKFFPSNEPKALAKGLLAFYKERAHWFEGRTTLSSWLSDNYSFEAMQKTFVQVISKMANE